MKKSPSHYGALANIYDAFLAVTGFKRGIENFLDRINFVFPKGAKVLDAGCGTGLISRYLSKRYPGIELYSSDIEPRMLEELKKILSAEGISNVSLYQNDLNAPALLRDFETSENISLPPNFFDAIITSGALEHVSIESVIPQLSLLLRPGGIFLNLGVRQSPAGAVLGMVYKFKPHSVEEIQTLCRKSGLGDIQTLELSLEDFPANLSRIAVLARKNF